jgi:hypothetical protein
MTSAAAGVLAQEIGDMASEASTEQRKIALLLGMVFAEELNPRRGQEFRDRVRCEATEKLGYHRVLTLDDKHGEIDEGHHAGKHVATNFADHRRMIRALRAKWGNNIQFNDVILDYFFSPVGWARERWKTGLFVGTIPQMAIQGMLSKGGRFILPYLNNVAEHLDEFQDEFISPYYTISFITNPNENPLYLATGSVTDELMRTPDVLTNETQLAPLLKHSTTPFVVLTIRDEFLSTVTHDSSPSKRKRSRSLQADIDADAFTPESKRK